MQIGGGYVALGFDNSDVRKGMAQTQQMISGGLRSAASEAQDSMRRLQAAAAATETRATATAKRVEAAARSEADALGKLRVAQAKLEDARSKGSKSAAQLVAAEEGLAKAQRTAAAARTESTKATRAHAIAQDRAKASAAALQSAERGVATAATAAGRSVTGMGSRMSTTFAAAKSHADGLKSKIGGLSGQLAGLAIGGGIVAGFADAVRAAGDLEQSIGGVEAVFKGAAGTINEASRSAAQSLGLSANAYNELITVSGAMLKNKGITEFAKESQNLVKVGADLAAQFGGSTVEAVDALNAAMRGESDPIERYGISLNAAAIEAQALSMGMQKVEGDFTDQQKALASLALVQKQSADAQGAFAREADTAQGKQQRLTAEFENQKTALGSQLLPAYSAALGGASKLLGGVTSLASYLNANADAFEPFADGAERAAGAFADLPRPISAAVVGLAAAVALRNPIASLGTGIATVGMKSRDAVASVAAFGQQMRVQQSLAAASGQSIGTFGAAMSVAGMKGRAAFSGLKVAASGLLGALGGPLGLALTAVSVGIGVWMDKSAAAKQRQEELKGVTDELSQTLRSNGGAWSDNATKQLLAQAAQKNVIGNLQNIGFGLKQSTDALLQDGTARSTVVSQINAHIAALKDEQMAADMAAGTFTGTNQQMIAYQESVRDNLLDLAGAGSAAVAQAKQMAEQERAAGVAGSAASTGIGAAKGATAGLGQAADLTADKLKKFRDAQLEASGQALSYREAMTAQAAAVKDTTKAIDEANAKQSRRGIVSSEEEQALWGLARADQAVAQSMVNSGKAASDTGLKMRTAAAGFYEAAIKAGYGKTRAQELTTELYRIPTSKGTTISLFNADGVLKSVSTVKRELAGIPTVHTITLAMTAIEGAMPALATAGPAGGMAAGAYGLANLVRKRVSRADGGVLPGYTPGRDVHSFTSPTGGLLELSGGEAVMRPEWTRAVGVEQINRWNAEARAGRRMRFASGGVIGRQSFASGGVVSAPSAVFRGVTASANAAGAAVRRAFTGTAVPSALIAGLAATAHGFTAVSATASASGGTTRGVLTRMVSDMRWMANQNEATRVREKAGMRALNDYFYMVGGGIRNTAARMVGDMRAPVRTILNEIIRDKLVWSWNAIAGKVKMEKWAFPGYRVGGYTGEGDEYDPAGIVHAGEFVIRKRSTKRIMREQPGLLESLNRDGRTPGYRTGGMVGGGGSSSPQGDASLVAKFLAKIATQIGHMYLWGGGHSLAEQRNPHSTRFDCSGLGLWGETQLGIRHTGGTAITMGRGARQIGRANAIRTPGAYLYNGHHIAYSLGNGMMIEAPQTGKPVRIAPVRSTLTGGSINPMLTGNMTAAELAALMAGGGGGGLMGPNPEAERLKGVIVPKLSAAKSLQSKVAGQAGEWGAMLSRLIPEMVDKTQATLTGKIDAAFPSIMVGGADSGESVAGPTGAAVTRWTDTIKQALSMNGLPTSAAYVNAWLRQISSESGGNNNIAQQIHDRNGTGDSAGVGLVQVIPETFARNRNPSLPNNRRDPLANLYAGIHYAKNRYGSRMLNVIGHGHGYHDGGMVRPTLYDTGGILQPGVTLVSNQTNKPETIRTYEQEKALQQNRGGGDINITVNEKAVVPELVEALRFAQIKQRNGGRYAMAGRSW